MTKLSKFVGALIMAAALGPQYASAAPCALADVTLTINSHLYNPTLCANGVNQGGGPTAETNSLNAALGDLGFVYLDKSDNAGTPVGIGGVRFVVTAGGGNSGTWSMSWAEYAGAPDLPLLIDFAVAVFGGNNGAGYFFNDVLLTSAPLSGTGTYDINFLNHGGQEPNLSHILLAGGNATHCDAQCQSSERLSPLAVPEPATLALLGISLAGLGFSRRKR